MLVDMSLGAAQWMAAVRFVCGIDGEGAQAGACFTLECANRRRVFVGVGSGRM